MCVCLGLVYFLAIIVRNELIFYVLSTCLFRYQTHVVKHCLAQLIRLVAGHKTRISNNSNNKNNKDNNNNNNSIDGQMAKILMFLGSY